MDYRPRIVDDVLARLVAQVPAVAIVGPKAVGKTESAKRLARSVVDLADDEQREVVRAARKRVLTGAETPLLIDEWQYDPGTWEAMRREVDAEPSPGRFILTGSANPRGVRVHSGAGRVVRLRMRPMSVAERGIERPTVSLAALWGGDTAIGGATSVQLEDYAKEIVDSGFPGVRFGAEGGRAIRMKSYVESALEQEIPELGFVPRRPASLVQWLRAYAAASSTTATYTAIADAVPDDSRPTRPTINAYRDVLTQLWLLDQVPPFTLSRNRLNELGRSPKHQLADPALAAALLNVTTGTLLDASAGREYARLRDGALLGTLFESLVTLSVRGYAQPLDLEVSHLRTARGEREVDLIVHATDGRAIAIEVKLAAAVGDHDVRHLNWLHGNLGEQLVDRMVVTTGTTAYRRADGVAVVPLALLGP